MKASWRGSMLDPCSWVAHPGCLLVLSCGFSSSHLCGASGSGGRELCLAPHGVVAPVRGCDPLPFLYCVLGATDVLRPG